MPKFSIIVPIYNVEKVFYRCLDSVVHQTFSDFECILVDDCSPDGCPQICDDYVTRDSRFAVIHKSQNEGLPKARKSGLDIAQGEFIVHVDSDDWLESNALELLYNEFIRTNADVVKGGMKRVLKNISITYIPPNITNSNVSVLEYYFLNDAKHLCGGAYRRNLFQEYIVPPIYKGEDAMTNVQIFSKMDKDKIKIISSIIYNYDMYNGGVSNERPGDFNSFNDYPAGFCRLWIEKYIRSVGVNSKEIDAFNFFMVSQGVIPYMRFNLSLKSKEIRDLYEKYYLPCSYKNKIRLPDRICLVLCANNFLLGKIALFFFNTLAKIVRSVKGV